MIKIELPNPIDYEKISEWLGDLKDVVNLLEMNINSMIEKDWEDKNLFASYIHNTSEIRELQDNDEEKYGDYSDWQNISIEINSV